MSPRVARTLLILGILLGLVGAIAPWIPHRAAGLNVGGFDMFEMTKFLPAVRSGAVPLWREAFLLPLLSMTLLLALIPSLVRSDAYFVRGFCPAVAAAISLLALPAYPFILTAHQNPEFRGQLLLSVGTFLVTLLSPLAHHLPRRILDGLGIALPASSLILSLMALARIHPLFVELYQAPVGVGWGTVTFVLGSCIVIIVSAFRKK